MNKKESTIKLFNYNYLMDSLILMSKCISKHMNWKKEKLFSFQIPLFFFFFFLIGNENFKFHYDHYELNIAQVLISIFSNLSIFQVFTIEIHVNILYL